MRDSCMVPLDLTEADEGTESTGYVPAPHVFMWCARSHSHRPHLSFGRSCVLHASPQPYCHLADPAISLMLRLVEVKEIVLSF